MPVLGCSVPMSGSMCACARVTRTGGSGGICSSCLRGRGQRGVRMPLLSHGFFEKVRLWNILKYIPAIKVS